MQQGTESLQTAEKVQTNIFVCCTSCRAEKSLPSC